MRTHLLRYGLDVLRVGIEKGITYTLPSVVEGDADRDSGSRFGPKQYCGAVRRGVEPAVFLPAVLFLSQRTFRESAARAMRAMA